MKRYSLVALMLVITVLAGCTPAYEDASQQGGAADSSKEPVKVGFVGPLTGDLANIGTNVQAAVQIAVEDVNAAGGIQGRPLQVVYEDDQCTGAKSSSAVSKLINVDKVAGVIGSTCSSATLSFTKIAEDAKVPVISYCSTAATITTAGDYIFRTVPSDNFQTTFAADYTYNKLAKRKAAIVYLNNDWGVGLRDGFKAAFTKLGGEVVLEEGFSPESKDLRAQMTKVKASTADLLYFPGFTDGTIAGLKQAKELGLTQTIFGADAWDDTKIWKEVGAAGDGVMFSVVGASSTDDFKAKMKAKLGSDDMIFCSNYAYDAVRVLADAMNVAGVDTTKVKDQLYLTKYDKGVGVKNIAFDKNGDPVEAVYVVKKALNGVAEELK